MKKTGKLIRRYMEAIVDKHGFAPSVDGFLYMRVMNGISQAIIFSATRHKSQYVVVCAITSINDGPSGDKFLSEKEYKVLLECSATKFILSPIAPFQNSYHWDFSDEVGSKRSMEEVVKLLRTQALPVFSTIDSRDCLRESQEQLHLEMIEREIRTFLAEELSEIGFRLAANGDFVWKPNGVVAAAIVPSVVGFGCFLIVYVVLWSPLLDGQKTMPVEPPPDFSKVAFVKVGKSGIVDGGPETLWFVGDARGKSSSLNEVRRILASRSFCSWLNDHQTFETMLHIIDPDLRTIVQRRIEETAR